MTPGYILRLSADGDIDVLRVDADNIDAELDKYVGLSRTHVRINKRAVMVVPHDNPLLVYNRSATMVMRALHPDTTRVIHGRAIVMQYDMVHETYRPYSSNTYLYHRIRPMINKLIKEASQ